MSLFNVKWQVLYGLLLCAAQLSLRLSQKGKHTLVLVLPVHLLWFSRTHLAAAGTSLHESRADHVLCEEVGVGVPADSVIDDGLPQALQPVRIVA